ncbi:Serine aminopeptidase, S33 [Paraburkholderia sartisoli]|uniref:Serine aminopeptidase, S33 n=2 Tax=Paraburkholderia sartisoli TaxID=83784 RepID=A0A1H4HAS0_9BURK|nr:Serine aminopeptidase, S33 [Paraburkholderia sartisoli]
MRPVTFAGCYGSLHLPARGGAATGMLLCNPFGYDALCVHRGWRDFAERVTVTGGIPVLRFDYPGAGDSEGNEEDPQRFRAWIDSIKAAAAYLRAATGVTRLILCGLRLGATLAVLAAEELGGVDSLVLMAPVIAGKRYIRELGMQHKSWLKTANGRESAQADDDGRAVGAFGFQLYADTLEQLAAVDLVQRGRPAARRVLLHDSCESVPMSQLVECYRGHGASVDVQIFTEYDKFLVDPRFSVPPRRAFDSVLEWLGFQSGAPATPAARILAPAADARIDFAAGHETPVVFGGGRYVGVFCRPRCAQEHAPAVLFVNTGGAHRVGDGRLAVLMARRLAGQGIASLRMDLGGLGDSLHYEDSPTLEAVYARHSVIDATAGVEWLIAAGYPQVVTFGVCTGAYVSFHTALAHPHVVGCMSVNLPFFLWEGPQTKPGAHHIESSQVYWRSIRNPRKWLRLLTGRANGRAIAVELGRRWYVRLTSLASTPFEGRLGVNTSTGAIRQLLMDLERRGVQTSLVYGPVDAGLDELAIRFGPNGSELGKLTNVTAKILEKVDHSLFSRTARDVVMAHFEEFLRERTLDAGRADVLDAAVLHMSSLRRMWIQTGPRKAVR